MTYAQLRRFLPEAGPAVGRDDGRRAHQAQPPLQSVEITFSGVHLLSRLLHTAWEARRRRRAYEGLATLPDHVLRDIGVSRTEVTRELRRPF